MLQDRMVRRLGHRNDARRIVSYVEALQLKNSSNVLKTENNMPKVCKPNNCKTN